MNAWLWIVWLAVGLICATICARVAAGKGRGPVGYAVLGFLVPLIGLIVVAVVPSRAVQQ